MILVDSNVPMYLIGTPHPLKGPAQRLLQDLTATGNRLVTDAEVLQEILHRYTKIGRREAIQPAFDSLLAVVDEVFPITKETTERAREIVLVHTHFSARDAIHLAVMQQQGIERILSFDAGFDRFPGIQRLY